MNKIYVHTNKEPWLAASLSWLLPGIGHLYSGAYNRGTFFLALFGLLYISRIISLLSTWILIIPTIILNLSIILVLPIYASWSAFRLTKRHNSKDFERGRSISKDPWLAVFLSLFLPGLGHIYLRKWIVGILSFLGLFVVVFFFRSLNSDFMIAVLIYRSFVSIHTYIICQLHKVKLKRPSIWFIIAMVCICLLKGLFLPQLQNQFMTFGPLEGTSMAPTIEERDSVIVNKFIYRLNHPKAGDVIIFHPPKYVSGKKIPSGKRIIAVGGETIQIRDGIVYVDGQERNFGFQVSRFAYPNSGPPLGFFGDSEYLTFGIDEKYHVPKGHYFVLGDNRGYSADSRWYGAIAREKIIGKVVKIYSPLRRMGIVR